MDAALKAAVNECLRPRGFTGSLPHLRRRSPDRICLLSVQHFSSGGSFVVEVAACGPEGVTTAWGKVIEPSKVNAQHITRPRPRLGSAGFPGSGDHWFVYGPRNYEPHADVLQPPHHYEKIAAEVMQLVETTAEPFWQSVTIL